jgi:hypothetical protein
MKIKVTRLISKALVICAVVVAAWRAFGLGSDYQNGQPVGGTSAWPEGLKELVNITNRTHGFLVNAEDVFFFSGNAANFSTFLRDYSKLQGIEKHRLLLHQGEGEAKSPWGKTGKACDWKLSACPNAWLARDGRTNGFVLEVHFWTGGKIVLDQVIVPNNVELSGEPLKAFESITNGMTRAEVEGKFTLDGGLQSASPARFLHPNSPYLKVNVEFDFKRDAADQNRAVTSKDDKVVRVSKPYVERPFLD